MGFNKSADLPGLARESPVAYSRMLTSLILISRFMLGEGESQGGGELLRSRQKPSCMLTYYLLLTGYLLAYLLIILI